MTPLTLLSLYILIGVIIFFYQFNFSRKKCCIIILAVICILGIPCSLGFGVLDFIAPLGLSILDFFDFMTNSIMMPISAA